MIGEINKRLWNRIATPIVTRTHKLMYRILGRYRAQSIYRGHFFKKQTAKYVGTAMLWYRRFPAKETELSEEEILVGP
jgi:hypothetical protein